MLPQLLYLSFQLRRANEIFLRCLTRHVCLDQTHVYLKRLADAKMSRLKSIFLIFDIFDQLFVLRFWSNICFELFDQMLVSRCLVKCFLRRLVKCVCFKVFEIFFFFGIVSQMFVQLLFSILLFNFHSIPIYVSPQVPLQVGSPTRTILKLRSFLSSRWPHSTGDYTVHITQLATQYR